MKGKKHDQNYLINIKNAHVVELVKTNIPPCKHVALFLEFS